MITQYQLKEILSYDIESGIFTHIKKRRGVTYLSSAGGVAKNGYVYINILGKKYLAHRLAWLYVHGSFPIEQIDHINGNRVDNKIINLRLATNAENGQNKKIAQENNATGLLGVSFYKAYQKFEAQICLNGKRKKLGYYDSAKDAHNAYIAEKRKIHPFCTI